MILRLDHYASRSIPEGIFDIRLRRSICAYALDMLASQTRDLSHIELERSDNISSLSVAKASRVNEVDISTERKIRARIEGVSPFILALSVCHIGMANYFVLKNIIKTEISAGETPLILDAWPRVSGFTLLSFWQASILRPLISL